MPGPGGTMGWRRIVRRVLLAVLYIATGLSVFDYTTHSSAMAYSSGVDVSRFLYHLALFLFYLADRSGCIGTCGRAYAGWDTVGRAIWIGGVLAAIAVGRLAVSVPGRSSPSLGI